MKRFFITTSNRLKKIPRRWLIIGLIVLAILGFIFRPRTNPANEPQFATVERQSLKVEVSASGILTGKNTASLHFQSGGLLSFLNVKTGDQVTSGQIIAGLDTRQLQSSLQQAQNTLTADQANVEKVLDDTHLFQYGNGGFANVGTANETETQRNNRIAAQEARDSAVDAVKTAMVALQNATIVSPISGTVIAADLLPGQNVLPTDTVAQISDFSQPEFDADVDESDISKVRLGEQANFTLNAYGDKNFIGQVIKITPLTHTTSSGATVVTVKISANDPTITPIAGLNGQANITTSESPNTLTIPISALRDDHTVLIQTPQGIQSVKVTTGLQNDTDAEILSGLKEGQKVVTNPAVVKLPKK